MRPSREVQINRALALLDRIIALIEADGESETAIAKQEPLLSLEQQERVRYQSRYWKDVEVRNAILSLYGRASARDASAIILAEFGPERAPPKSTMARIFARIAEAAPKPG